MSLKKKTNQPLISWSTIWTYNQFRCYTGKPSWAVFLPLRTVPEHIGTPVHTAHSNVTVSWVRNIITIINSTAGQQICKNKVLMLEETSKHH